GGRLSVADVIAHGGSASPAPGQHPPADARGGPTGSASTGSSDKTRSPGALGVPAAGQTPTEVAGGSHRVPHTATRKRIAEHMVQSLLHTPPHVTTGFRQAPA